MRTKKKRNFKREVKKQLKLLYESNQQKSGIILNLINERDNAVSLLEQYRNFLKEPVIEWWTERSPRPDYERYRFQLKSPEKYLWLQAYAELDTRVQTSLIDVIFEDKKREFAAEWFKSMKFVSVSSNPYERQNPYKKDYVHIPPYPQWEVS